MKCFDSLALERDHRTAMIFEKCAVNVFPINHCLSQYQRLLTPYVHSFVAKQFKLSDKVNILLIAIFILMGRN